MLNVVPRRATCSNAVTVRASSTTSQRSSCDLEKAGAVELVDTGNQKLVGGRRPEVLRVAVHRSHPSFDDGISFSTLPRPQERDSTQRVSGNPGAIQLDRATESSHHELWPCSISLLDDQVVDRSRLHSARQVTDIYLLALAVAHGGRLATFDRSIPMSAVAGADESHLVVI